MMKKRNWSNTIAQGAAEPFVTDGLPPVQPLVSTVGNGGPMGALRGPSDSTEG